MSYNWGPHYIVPSKSLHSYSGIIQLREELDEELLQKELESLGIHGTILKVTNPWYCRRKDRQTWIKIGESADKEESFPTSWDTRVLENGQYEIMGLMHVFVKKADTEIVIARQNIVEVTVEN
ncbi:MAG: hypothetical protein AVO38_01865 [delta proteobacterium ML8_D]|jgi:hypothetical protein|nr:MAG: hypothetical protein AVO38_01865 [delta proteobacterium ML8_D]